MRLNQRNGAAGSLCPGLRISAQSAGESVNATMPEITTDTAMVIANCLYICPARPPRKPTGMNTAQSTNTMAMIGPVTSSIALIAASRGPSFSVLITRSTFSSTTMASSTTIPMASTRPNRVSRLMEKPSAYIPAKVPISETGIARIGISVARMFCRNRKTTSITRISASTKVWTTSSMDTFTNTVVS
ncbi:hypothetical protein D9M71_423660 [compost metagenome]